MVSWENLLEHHEIKLKLFVAGLLATTLNCCVCPDIDEIDATGILSSLHDGSVLFKSLT
jgi:hypothetical protein